MNEIANVYSRKPRKIKNNKSDNVNVENNLFINNNNMKKKSDTSGCRSKRVIWSNRRGNCKEGCDAFPLSRMRPFTRKKD